jgi:hypothetical protein
MRAVAVTAAMVAGLGLGPLGSPASAANAPSCVDFWTTGNIAWKTFHVYNGCSTKQRLKIIIGWHADSGCETVYPGYEWTYGVPGQSTLDNVVTC